MTPQERFEIVYADVTGESVESLPQFRCKAIDSYLDPKMSRAYLFFKAADERAEQARALLREIENWLVCSCIATAEDMAQSFEPFQQQIAAFLGEVPQ